MRMSELYELLELPEEVVLKLDEYERNRQHDFHVEIEDLMQDAALMQGLDGAVKDAVGEDEDGMKTLWEELNIAAASFEEYRKRGIPVTVFIDTMKFCTRFLEEHYKTYSCYRFTWGWWFSRQLSLREFRLGALEYEYNEEQCISIHIPSDADLSPESVRESLLRFREFCRQYYPSWENLKMQCASWMLSPALTKMLAEDSHILAFQKLFEGIETDYESMAVLDWVFPGYDHVSEQLPGETSLQRNMKKYLLEGGKIGWAKGTLARREEQ